jgi:hypothetical protein
MNQVKIDVKKLEQMLRAGKSQTEAAKFFGVTTGAINQVKQKLMRNIVRTVGLEKAKEVVDCQFDIMGQLKKASRVVNDEIDWLVEVASKADTDAGRVALQELIIKHAAEIRKQTDAQMRLFELWTDAKLMAEFQREVLTAMEEMQPGVRDAIIRRLKEKRALRGVVEFN